MVKHRVTRKYKNKHKLGGGGSPPNSRTRKRSRSPSRSRSSSRSSSSETKKHKSNFREILTLEEIKRMSRDEFSQLDRVDEARKYVLLGKSKFDVFQVLATEQQMFLNHLENKIKNSNKSDTHLSMIKYINNRDSLYEDNTERKLKILLNDRKTELRELLDEYQTNCDNYENEIQKHYYSDIMTPKTYEDMKICTIYLRYILGYH